MPTSTIPAGNLYMNAVTYTGNGTNSPNALTVSSLNFQPDLIWIKNRGGEDGYWMQDTVRGLGFALNSDTTGIDLITGGGDVSSVTSTGFVISYANSRTNASANNYVAWCWRAGGAPVSNGDGNIASQVSANTTSGFSVVTYTGTGATATVGHGLGVAPSMIILKSRVTSYNWAIWHKSLGGGDYALQLNTDIGATNAFDYWNGDPTDTRFTLGTDLGSNRSAETYVAYCWAEVAGFSKFGFWSGNSSTNGPFVYLGFRPRFILFKRSSGDGNNWRITDTSRSTSNPNATAFLYPDVGSVENSNANDSMDILSNGFKLRATAQASNETGSTYIYMAFAENPFKYANAR